MAATREAKCYRWALLLATLLLDLGVVIEVLQEMLGEQDYDETLNQFKTALKASGWYASQRNIVSDLISGEYIEMVHSIEEVLSLT
jgi:hypothetical protein